MNAQIKRVTRQPKTPSGTAGTNRKFPKSPTKFDVADFRIVGASTTKRERRSIIKQVLKAD